MNAAFSELRSRDALQPDIMFKILSVYNAVKHLVAAGCANQVSSLIGFCQLKYGRERWEYMNGLRSVPSFRNAIWPLLHNKSHQTMQLLDEGEFLSCRIRLVGGWFKFRLRSGSNYRDQIRALRSAMQNGQIRDSQLRWQPGEAAVLDVSVLLPVVDKKQGITAKVCTAHDSLLQVSLPRSIIPWIYCSLVYRENKAGYERRMYELRRARKKGESKKGIKKLKDPAIRNFGNRTKDFIGCASRKVIDYCLARGVSVIEYDDIVKSAFRSFPWHGLKFALQYKAANAGIEFRIVKHAERDDLVDFKKPHVYFIYDPVSHRVKIGRSEDFGKRLKTFLTSNPGWVCLAIENYKKGDEVAAEKHYLARFDSSRLVDRGCSGHEVREAGPVLEFLQEAGWIGNTGNLSQLMQVPSLEKFTDGVGRLQADGDDETGTTAG